MRADQVETAWDLVMPILESWEASPPEDFPNYAAGTWGPDAATQLMARDGRHWHAPLWPGPEEPARTRVGSRHMTSVDGELR